MLCSLRSIHVRCSLTLLTAAALAVALPASSWAGDDGFKPIFNGQNLDGWDGNPKFWSVVDGTIQGKTTADNPTKGNTFLIWRQAPVDDFELQAELQDRRRKLGHSVSQQGSRPVGRRRIPGRFRSRRHVLRNPLRRTRTRHPGQPRTESHHRQSRQKRRDPGQRHQTVAGQHQEGRLERLRDYRPGQPPDAQDQRPGDCRGDRRRGRQAGHQRNPGLATARRAADDRAIQKHPPQAHQAGRWPQEDRDGRRHAPATAQATTSSMPAQFCSRSASTSCPTSRPRPTTTAGRPIRPHLTTPTRSCCTWTVAADTR